MSGWSAAGEKGEIFPNRGCTRLMRQVYAGSQRLQRAGIACFACTGLAFLVSIQPAFGQGSTPEKAPPSPITIVEPAALPFSSGELAQALLARLFPSDDGGVPHVQVTPADAGAVTVKVGVRSRLVTLADRSGPAAARVVALVIAELMTIDPNVAEEEKAEDAEEEDADPEPPAGVVARAPKVLPPSSVTIAAPASEPTDAGQPLHLFLTGGLAKGMGSDELLAGIIDADVALPSPLGPEWLQLMPSAGWVYTPTHNAGSFREVSFSQAIVRVLGGADVGPLNFAAGPFLARYNLDGVADQEGFLFGAEALARWGTQLFSQTRLVVTARAHAYGNRLRVAYADGGSYATPRLEATIGVGVAWDSRP